MIPLPPEMADRGQLVAGCGLDDVAMMSWAAASVFKRCVKRASYLMSSSGHGEQAPDR